MWLRHLLLEPDGHSDPPGIKVRAYAKAEAITYLEPGFLVGPASYVFGPVRRCAEKNDGAAGTGCCGCY